MVVIENIFYFHDNTKGSKKNMSNLNDVESTILKHLSKFVPNTRMWYFHIFWKIFVNILKKIQRYVDEC